MIKFVYFDFSQVLVEKIASLIGDTTVPGFKKYLLKPHTMNALEVLSRKYRLGICSNSRAKKVRKTLENLGLSHFFEIMVLAQEVGVSKPSQEIYEQAIELADVKADEIAFVDDSEKNIIGAFDTGIKNCFLYGKEKDLTFDLDCVQSIETLLELPNLIAKIS